MKRIGILLLITIMLLPVQAIALEFQVDGLTYALNADGESVTVEAADKSLSQCEIPDRVAYGSAMYDVTEIGNAAFQNREKLKHISFPSGLKEIGYAAFKGCDSLEELVLPDGLEIVGEQAFRYCRSLRNIDIPDSVNTVELDAFMGCDSLERLSMPVYTCADDLGLTNLKLLQEIVLTGNMELLSDNAFRNLGHLKKVTLNENLETIGENAFYGCTSLSELVIPKNVKKIGTGAFFVSGLQTIIFKSEIAPKLESVSGIFPAGVQIVTPDNAVGYTKENGWPISATGDNEDGGACDLCIAPECTMIRQGDNYVFSVKRVVQNAAYQWQSSKDGVHFTNIAGETDSTMIMKATTQTNGMSVRCVVLPSSNVITLSGGAENDLYPILNGADAIWSGLGNQIVRVDAQYHKFLRVRVNGVELVNGRDYLTHSGSTIVELKQEYLSSLAPGTYVMKMEFTDGKAETTFVIPTPAGTEELPDTGDHSMMMLWLTIGCAAVLLMCLGVRRRIE